MVTIGREIGPGRPCFLIAEAGVNHDGDLSRALELVDVSAAAGVDAVKFQTFRAEAVASAGAPKAGYQELRTPRDETQIEMLRRLELGREAHVELKGHAEAKGLVFLSTPFDVESVGLLVELGVVALKVASPDVVNVPLLRRIGAARLPVILSTGTADLEEIELAVSELRRAGAVEIVVLHCVTAYPADPADANLRAMKTIADRLEVPVGYSDHTEGLEVALAAVALGATVLEKHVTLDRSLPGPDQLASLEPGELAALVRGVRRVEASLGNGRKQPVPNEQENARVARRSIAAAQDLAAGVLLEPEMLVALRPGTGISPRRIDEVVGKRLRRALARGELLRADDFV